jgi:photosystem II stability/assembly factor-like uncharacterized protein
VGAIVRAQPLENRRGFVLGADRDCALTQFSTGDGGKTWVKQATEGGWARALDRPNEALTPRLDRSRPCGDRPIVDLSRASADQGQALCANGELKVTSDGGATWSDAGVAEGGLALSTRLEQGVLSTYVARVDKACAGVQVVRAVAGQQPRPVACVGSTTTAKPGIVSLSTVSDGGWLRVGDETWTAPGSLESWARA